MASLTDRMIRAARLDATLYEEVEADTTATGQATAAVVLSSVAAGIGGAGDHVVAGVIVGTLASLLGWYIWSFLTWVIGTRVMPEAATHADFGQLLRTIGFSSAPGVLRVGGILPGIGPIVVAVASLWMLCAMVVGVRQALDYTSTGRAVAVCVIGWIVQLAIILLPLLLLGAVTSHSTVPTA